METQAQEEEGKLADCLLPIQTYRTGYTRSENSHAGQECVEQGGVYSPFNFCKSAPKNQK